MRHAHASLLALSCLALTACATPARHTSTAEDSAAAPRIPAVSKPLPSDRRLLPFLGRWTVEATFPPLDGSEPLRLSGDAVFTPDLDGRSVHERLELDGFLASVSLGYSSVRGRYELSQIDTGTGGQLWLVGRWSPDGATLELEPAEPFQLTGLGFDDMRWTYAFDREGRLIKTIRVLETDGYWRTQSVYTYSRAVAK